MLMNSDPSPVALLEDDALTLKQCAVTFTRCNVGPHGVRENGDVAKYLHPLIARTASSHAESRGLPRLPFGLILSAAIEPSHRCVESERGFRCETREVTGGILAAKGRDN